MELLCSDCEAFLAEERDRGEGGLLHGSQGLVEEPRAHADRGQDVPGAEHFRVSFREDALFVLDGLTKVRQGLLQLSALIVDLRNDLVTAGDLQTTGLVVALGGILRHGLQDEVLPFQAFLEGALRQVVIDFNRVILLLLIHTLAVEKKVESVRLHEEAKANGVKGLQHVSMQAALNSLAVIKHLREIVESRIGVAHANVCCCDVAHHTVHLRIVVASV
mmetsp:Transcript_87656/g.188043  ORF Transcript_87656/g.188043 Transcript_87656/m.188043 type:complete len:219 (-) Transcript_87656:858-1514(-)